MTGWMVVVQSAEVDCDAAIGQSGAASTMKHVTDEMRPLALLREVTAPIDLALGESFARDVIPALFGTEFNPGRWYVGHVVLNDQKAHILLVTLNKQGKAEVHRYLDHWPYQSHHGSAPMSVVWRVA